MIKKNRLLVLYVLLFSPGITIPSYSFDYVLHKDFMPRTALSQPAKGTPVTDPNFNTTFVRISNATTDNVGNRISMIVYSRWTPLSSGQEYLYLQRTVGNPDMLLYSAKDFSLIKIMPEKISIDGVPNQTFNSMESSEIRWDYTGTYPNRFYYVNGMKFFEYDVQSDTAHLLHDFRDEFPSGDHVHNDVEGDSSADSRYWVFMVRGKYDGNLFPTLAIITYDKQTNALLGILDYTKYQSLGGKMNYLPTPNMVDMSPSGKKAVCLWGRCWGDASYGSRYQDIGSYFDGPHAWDLDFSNPVKVAADQAHSGWAWDYNGNEVFVSQNNREDWIEVRNVQTGEITQMLYHGDLGWGNGMHFGRMPFNIKGWVLMSTYKSSSSDWGDNQLIMLEIKDKSQNPRVWRLGHTHNNYDEYYAEGFAAMSQYGDKLWWSAKWPGQNNIETYEMTLPNHWWVELAGGDATPPYASGHAPAKNAQDVHADTDISMHLRDDGMGVDIASVKMEVNGDKVYDGSHPGSYPHTVVTGSAAHYIITYSPPHAFDPGTRVFVAVNGQDNNTPSNVMPRDEYYFTVGIKSGYFNTEDSFQQTRLQILNGILKGSNDTDAIIRYYVTEESHAVIKIYDTRGRDVLTVHEGIVPAGIYSAAWNGTDHSGNKLGSGVYLVDMRAGAYHATKKIVIVR